MQPYNTHDPTWVENSNDADVALVEILKYPVVGYDSEFDQVDILHESCVAKSRLDVFSIAVPSGPLTGEGYRKTRTWVFDSPLIRYAPIKAWLEDPDFTKCIHNAPVDVHTARNAGVSIKGYLNTLSLARWVYPWRAALISGNFDLDSLAKWRIGHGKTQDFDEFLGYDAYEDYEDEFYKKRCLGCGEVGCRKRKAPHDAKEEVLVREVRQRKVRRIRPLQMVRRNGEHADIFDQYIEYAAADADLAMIMYDMMMLDGKQERYYPWSTF